jgi:hypothetical protein
LIAFNAVVAVLFIERHDLRRKDEDALYVFVSTPYFSS